MIWVCLKTGQPQNPVVIIIFSYFFHMFPMEKWLLLSIPHFQTKPFVQDAPSSQELVVGEGKGFWAGVSDASDSFAD